MLTRSRSYYLMRLERLRRIRRVRNLATLGLVVLGPVLALVTYLVLGPLEQGGNTPSLRIILLIDLVYILLVAALVLSEVARQDRMPMVAIAMPCGGAAGGEKGWLVLP